MTCLYRFYYTRGLWKIHYAESQVEMVMRKVGQKGLPILGLYRQALFVPLNQQLRHRHFFKHPEIRVNDPVGYQCPKSGFPHFYNVGPRVLQRPVVSMP